MLKRFLSAQSHFKFCLNYANQDLYLFGFLTARKFSTEVETKSNAKKKKETSYISTITNETAADLIFKHLEEDSTDNDVYIEIDPGKGLLSKKLLSLTNSKLLLFDPPHNWLTKMNMLCASDIDRVNISQLNFHYFYKYFWHWKMLHDSRNHLEFQHTLKTHCPPSANLKIIGTISYSSFFYSLLSDYSMQASLYEDYLNPTLYLYVPFNIYSSIFRTLKYNVPWRMGVVVNVFFEVSFLGIAPKNYFQSSFRMSRLYRYKNSNELKNLFLIKMTPKDVNIIREKSFGNVAIFHYFMSYLIRIKAQSNLIAALEAFVPDCGEEFIKNGFRVFDHPSQLSEEEWFRAFQVFISLPGYASSPFPEEMKRQLGIFSDEVMSDNAEEMEIEEKEKENLFKE